MVENYFQIAKMIAAALAGELTEEEQQQLEAWRKVSVENELLYYQIMSEENRRRQQQEWLAFSTETGWEELRQKRMRRKLKLYSRWSSWAAVLVLGLGIGFYFLFQPAPVSPAEEYFSYLPGIPKALLTLADGKVIDLETHQGKIDLQEAVVQNQENILSYTDTFTREVKELSPIYNQIDVPRCGEYQVKLGDGSVVFLNSQTRLRFPVRFSGNIREVELSGEAYFVVAENPEKPFVVRVGEQSVTVLGTQFNISAFENEDVIRTTLVTGKVRVEGGKIKESVVLSPDEQFVYNKKNQQHAVHRVNPLDYTAWKDGQFRFRDVRLDEIMRSIGRWYGVDVEYADPEVRAYVFGLNFSRHGTIEPLLRIFEENGKIEIQRVGKKLVIRKGR